MARRDLRLSLVERQGPASVLCPLLFWVVDLVGAVLLLIGLVWTMLGAVAFLNQIGPAPLMDLRAFFADLYNRDANLLWIYLMVFSTLLPTVAHFLLFVGGAPPSKPDGR